MYCDIRLVCHEASVSQRVQMARSTHESWVIAYTASQEVCLHSPSPDVAGHT